MPDRTRGRAPPDTTSGTLTSGAVVGADMSRILPDAGRSPLTPSTGAERGPMSRPRRDGRRGPRRTPRRGSGHDRDPRLRLARPGPPARPGRRAGGPGGHGVHVPLPPRVPARPAALRRGGAADAGGRHPRVAAAGRPVAAVRDPARAPPHRRGPGAVAPPARARGPGGPGGAGRDGGRARRDRPGPRADRAGVRSAAAAAGRGGARDAGPRASPTRRPASAGTSRTRRPTRSRSSSGC